LKLGDGVDVDVPLFKQNQAPDALMKHGKNQRSLKDIEYPVVGQREQREWGGTQRKYIIIYFWHSQLAKSLVQVLKDPTLSTCNIIIAGVLGYKLINNEDAKYFENLFSNMKNYIFNKEVTNKVIELRQTTNIKLPDAINAATTLANGLVLWTHNQDDFKKVPELQLFDPISSWLHKKVGI
jgi:predicted nucleic acid-binding protein